ncbi:hypothetical protein FRB90_007641 [Tulasnella sp. 427]|nr:hypothetical protein FRB90_007641 [Tulasnella sp. 427]
MSLVSRPPAPPLKKEIESLVYTHKSLFGKPANMQEDYEDPQDWERVAFLGEGILLAAMSRVLYHAHPRHRTSWLKPHRTRLLSKESLASITDEYGFMVKLKCLEPSRQNIARSLDNRAALAESFVGGVALEYGMEKARLWAEEMLAWKHELPVPVSDEERLGLSGSGEKVVKDVVMQDGSGGDVGIMKGSVPVGAMAAPPPVSMYPAATPAPYVPSSPPPPPPLPRFAQPLHTTIPPRPEYAQIAPPQEVPKPVMEPYHIAVQQPTFDPFQVSAPTVTPELAAGYGGSFFYPHSSFRSLPPQPQPQPPPPAPVDQTNWNKYPAPPTQTTFYEPIKPSPPQAPPFQPPEKYIPTWGPQAIGPTSLPTGGPETSGPTVPPTKEKGFSSPTKGSSGTAGLQPLPQPTLTGFGSNLLNAATNPEAAHCATPAGYRTPDNNGTSKQAKPLRANRGVQGVEGYFPASDSPIGSAILPESLGTKNENIPLLFTPLKIRDVEFKNRIFVAPMCQYSADDGAATDWHLVHLGGFATRGVAAITVEATGIVPEGRISPEDMGIWDDKHIAPLKRIVNFVHAQGTKIGIQLAHAGRKASTHAPWAQADLLGKFRNNDPSHVATKEEGGWPENVVGPSAVSFDEKTYPMPRALTLEEIEGLKQKYVEAIERAKAAGFDWIELHFAHGYLMHEFLSPLSNKRTDQYGGSLENRTRFALEVAEIARKVWGESKPLFVRLSATDWDPRGEKNEQGEWISWGIEQTKWLSAELAKKGVDLIDTSSGGNLVTAKIKVEPGYQVPFAEAIKKDNKVDGVGAVGLITEPHQAEEILQKGQADVIFLARELLRHADWPIYAAQQLGVIVQPAVQYERAWTRMIQKRKD